MPRFSAAKHVLTLPKSTDPLLTAVRLGLTAVEETPTGPIPDIRIDEVFRALGPEFGQLGSKVMAVAATSRDFFYILAATQLFQDPPEALRRIPKVLAMDGYRFTAGRGFLSKLGGRFDDTRQPLDIGVLNDVADQFIGAQYWKLETALRTPAPDRYRGVNERVSKVRKIRFGEDKGDI